jgi:hypothetical protein
LIDHLRTEENQIRQELKIKEDFPFSNRDYEKIIEMTLKNPTEAWVGGEELSEEFCYIIKKFDPKELSSAIPPSEVIPPNLLQSKGEEGDSSIYCIVMTLLFENTPSFVLTEILTRNEDLLNFYRKGKPFQDSLDLSSVKNSNKEPSNRKSPYIDTNEFDSSDESLPELSEEMLAMLESKRSTLMNELLRERSKSDILIEEFSQYDIFLAETLDRPDEIFRYKDQDKDTLFIYVRTYSQDSKSFYYIVMCMQYQNDMETEDSLLVPILSFPSLDVELYRKYKRGEKIGGPPIN